MLFWLFTSNSSKLFTPFFFHHCKLYIHKFSTRNLKVVAVVSHWYQTTQTASSTFSTAVNQHLCACRSLIFWASSRLMDIYRQWKTSQLCSVSNGEMIIRSHGAISVVISPKNQEGWVLWKLMDRCRYPPAESVSFEQKNKWQHDAWSNIFINVILSYIIRQQCCRRLVASRLNWMSGWRAWLELRPCWRKPPQWRTQEAKWSLSFNTLSVEISGHVRPCALTSRIARKSREQRERRQYFHTFKLPQ